MKLRLNSITGFILTGLLSISVFADRDDGQVRSHHRGRGKYFKILKKIDLTEEQKNKVKEIRKEQRTLLKSIRTNKKAAHKKLHDLMKANAADSLLKSAHKQVLSLRSQMDSARFEKMLKIRKVLTPKQIKKLNELKMRRRHHHENDSDDDE